MVRKAGQASSKSLQLTSVAPSIISTPTIISAGAVAAEGADLCVVTSDNPRSEAPEGIVEDVLRGMVRFDKVKIVEPDRVRAIRLGLSKTAVSTRISRGRQFLRDIVEREGFLLDA